MGAPSLDSAGLSGSRRNLVFNFLGSIWTVGVQIASIPIFVHLLGIESFGLIGFYVTLLATLQVLDLGLSPTMNRQMASYSADPTRRDEMRSFARTLEIGYWALGMLLGILVAACSGLIAERWLNVESVPTQTAQAAVAIMGLLVALQWPLSFYQGGLLGLQKQVRLNVVKIVAVTVSQGGAILILLYIERTVEAFFAWQIVASALHVAVITLVFWRSLPAGMSPLRPALRLARSVAGFAGGMTGIVFFSMVLVQMDKVVISRALPLSTFGYYALAGSLASGLLLVVNPIFALIFPRLSSLVAAGDQRSMRRVYESGLQLMACLLIPVLLIMVTFTHFLLVTWTGDEKAADSATQIVRLLAIGTALNGLMHMPYALQLAHGWTALALRLTVVQVCIFLPLLSILVSRFGAAGAALSWALLNAASLPVSLYFSHSRYLPELSWPWLMRSLGAPFAAAAAVVFFGALVWGQRNTTSGMWPLAMVLAIGCVAVLAASLCAPIIRAELFRWFRNTWPTRA